MRSAPFPLIRDVVLVGGGHTHALMLRRWGMRPLAGARLTLINPSPTAPYTGMLPGYVAGHYPREALEIDLVRLARHAGARLILGRSRTIDRETRQVRFDGRPPIGYDIASLDVGVTSAMPELPGFAEHAVPAKPLRDLAERWARFADDPPDRPRLAVIGGGVAGVELAMATAWRLRRLRPAVTVIDAGRALAGTTDRGRRLLLARMQAFGIELLENAEITHLDAGGVHLTRGMVPSDFTIGAAGARPPSALADKNLTLTDGYVAVDETLRMIGDPAIYAVGDCAHMTHAPRPKAGVYAVRQAPTLYANIRADLAGSARRRYRPQGDYLKLISLGGKAALAEKWGMAIAAPALWRWKDRIDRRFMDRFADLAPMPGPALPRERVAGLGAALGPKPLCGGCGAKVGGDPLAAVLGGVGDDAAVLASGDRWQAVSTDHLRAVTEDPWVMARIAATHALGDVWAMAARPQAALATVILPRMSEELQARTLAEIVDGAERVFGAEGCRIVGGHTSIGAELTIGFTVIGVGDAPPVGLGGAQPGDRLVLTKPLGSGTILAAEMQLAARGAWVTACLAAMQTSQGEASRLLARAHAMTDVTGYGLAGHLANICRTSGVAAEIDLAAVPVLPGAVELAARGIRSTIYPANLRHAFATRAPSDPHAALLYDPQTAGGLVAAVAPDEADATVMALRDAGVPASVVGRIVEGPPRLRITGRAARPAAAPADRSAG
jgi:selenide,water dikinase